MSKTPNGFPADRRIKARILEFLATAGPSAALEVAHGIGESRKVVASALSSMHKRGKAHIGGWTRDDPMGGGYQLLRALYSAGSGKDKPKPPAWTREERRARIKARRDNLRTTPISIFHLGAMLGAQVQGHAS